MLKYYHRIGYRIKGGKNEDQRQKCIQGQSSRDQPKKRQTEVIIDIPGGFKVVSMISKNSAAHLNLKKGKTAYAVIKASSVMVAID